MTGAELTAFESTARSVVGIIRQIVRQYRESRIVDHNKTRELQLTADSAYRQAMALALGELARIHIQEIAETQRLIDSLKLKEEALGHAMRHLEKLSYALEQNLEGLRRG